MFRGMAITEASTQICKELLRKALLLQAITGFARRKPLGAIGAVIFICLVLIAILAPVISPHDPEEIFPSRYVFSGPSEFMPFGGDEIGRDIMSRIFYGTRISLLVGVISVMIGVTVGSLFGVFSAYFGGAFDLLMQRIVDGFMAFPAIILALAIVAVLGSSITNVIIALVFVFTPNSIRTVRSQALAIKEMDYILAARALGASNLRIVFRHMVPNVLAMFIILATLNLGFAIIVEASISFLGVGIPPNIPSWGSMLAQGSQAYVENAPWLILFPGIAISLAVFAVNLLGDALRDILDPRLRGAR